MKMHFISKRISILTLTMQRVLTIILPFLGLILNYEMMYENTKNTKDLSFKKKFQTKTAKAAGEKVEIAEGMK